MSVNLARAVGRLQALLARRFHTPITVGSLLAFLTTIAAFAIVVLAPYIDQTGGSWFKPTTWPSAVGALSAGAIVPLLAAGYLKFSERYRRRAGFDRPARRSRMTRKLTAGRAISDLYRCLTGGATDSAQLQRVRESVLECIAYSVRDVLQWPAHEKIVATLVVLTDSADRMRVVARSTREREIGVEYARDQLVGWEAIRNGHIVVVDDVTEDPRWSAVGGRRYKSVCGIPVARTGKAFGAVSVDSESAYAFYGRSADLAIELEPYIALIALTFTDSEASVECRYVATHVGRA